MTPDVQTLMADVMSGLSTLDRVITRLPIMYCVSTTDDDGHGVFTDVIGASHTLLGWTNEELTGQRFLDLLHPDDQDRTAAEWARIVSENKPAESFLNRYRRKDGSYRWMCWISDAGDAAGVFSSLAYAVDTAPDFQSRIREIEAGHE